MPSVYRKTGKGLVEIGTRANRLAPRLRQALVMVDGSRTDEDLSKLILSQPAETLAVLLEQGYIELAPSVSPRAASSNNSGFRSVPPEDSLPQSSIFTDHRQQAVHFINEQLGPPAEALAMKLEKAADWAQLRPLLETAEQFLRSARGPASAADFAERFIASLP